MRQTDWETKTFEDIYQIGSSRRVHKKDWRETGVPFYRAREIVKLAKQGYVDNDLFISEELYEENKAKTGVPVANDLMITAVGTLGECYVVKEHDRFYFKDASVLWFRPKGDVSARFMEYAFQSPQIAKQTLDSAGATVGTLTISRAKSLEISLPSLPEQQQIVAILDKAFVAIDQAVANAELNLTNARELFESYLNKVFTERGEGWVRYQLSEITTKIGSGSTPRGGASSYKVEGISLIRSLNVYDRAFRSNKLAYIDEEQANKLSNVVVEDGDVLFNITGASVARCCKAPADYLPARVNQHVSIIRPKQEIVSTDFLNYLITAQIHKEELLGIGNKGGSTRQAITKKQLQDFFLHIPKDRDEQDGMVHELDMLSAEVFQLETIYQQKLTAITELKQSILQKAFRGELTAGESYE